MRGRGTWKGEGREGGRVVMRDMYSPPCATQCQRGWGKGRSPWRAKRTDEVERQKRGMRASSGSEAMSRRRRRRKEGRGGRKAKKQSEEAKDLKIIKERKCKGEASKSEAECEGVRARKMRWRKKGR